MEVIGNFVAIVLGVIWCVVLPFVAVTMILNGHLLKSSYESEMLRTEHCVIIEVPEAIADQLKGDDND